MKPLHLYHHDGILVLEIDNPPVNATSQAVRQALIEAVQQAQGDHSVQGLVIAGFGRTFTAGGDINEFGRKPREPHLPQVFDAIEASAKPVVVAWHGTAFGGGCEMGLAAHGRVIAKDGVVGLPEVKLGLIPGAGGTQRLPRLIGPVAALDIIATGRVVSAEEALNLSIADYVVSDDLRAEAIAFARQLAQGRVIPTSQRSTEKPSEEDWLIAVDKVRRQAKGREAPLRAVELVAASIEIPFRQGLELERRAFLDLMMSDQSRALRHLFQAERSATKLPWLTDISTRSVTSVGVIGAGTMGSGIAIAFLDAGFDVTLVETNETVVAAGLDRIRGIYQRSHKSGRVNQADLDERLSRLKTTTVLADLATCHLVVEAIFEDMQVKLDLLQKLSAILPRDTFIATNTSYLDVEKMADALPAPERFVGLHFFSPAHVMKLLEIVRGRRTSPETLAAALAIGRKLKKVAVVAGVCDGFIGNRILAKTRAQCESMLGESALPHEIDAAMEAFGMAMGPFAVQDLAGLDIAWARRRQLLEGGLAGREVSFLGKLCDQGHFGQKVGRGWYRYDNGRRQRDPEVEAMILAQPALNGRSRQPFEPREIQNRIIASMVNEGAKIVAEGIAIRPADVDLVLVNGYGFPNWRGGPMHYADTIGLPTVLAIVEATAALEGSGFEVASLLTELAGQGRQFSSLNV